MRFLLSTDQGHFRLFSTRKAAFTFGCRNSQVVFSIVKHDRRSPEAIQQQTYHAPARGRKTWGTL